MFTPRPRHNPTPLKKERFFLDLDSLQFVKKITNAESSWQIIQSEKKMGGVWEEVCVVWASVYGGEVVVSDFFDKESIFFWGGGGKKRGEGKCMCMNKCFKWYFYSSRRTPVQNYFEIHAYM